MKYQVEIKEIDEEGGPSCIGRVATLFAWGIIGLSFVFLISEIL